MIIIIRSSITEKKKAQWWVNSVGGDKRCYRWQYKKYDSQLISSGRHFYYYKEYAKLGRLDEGPWIVWHVNNNILIFNNHVAEPVSVTPWMVTSVTGLACVPCTWINVFSWLCSKDRSFGSAADRMSDEFQYTAAEPETKYNMPFSGSW